MGSHYIYWARSKATEFGFCSHMWLEKQSGHVLWPGKKDLNWFDLISRIQRRLKQHTPPNIPAIHFGSNYFKLWLDICENIGPIDELEIGSELLPRRIWNDAKSATVIEF